MNLYNFHAKPKLLDGYDSVPENNPHFFWEKYRNNKEELKKREKYIAKDAEYSYDYARDVLRGPFPAGEEAISKNNFYANEYAVNVLGKDFYLNGKLIAKA